MHFIKVNVIILDLCFVKWGCPPPFFCAIWIFKETLDCMFVRGTLIVNSTAQNYFPCELRSLHNEFEVFKINANRYYTVVCQWWTAGNSPRRVFGQSWLCTKGGHKIHWQEEGGRYQSSRVLTRPVLKHTLAFSNCLWRGFSMLMYCDLLTKSWFPN